MTLFCACIREPTSAFFNIYVQKICFGDHLLGNYFVPPPPPHFLRACYGSVCVCVCVCSELELNFGRLISELVARVCCVGLSLCLLAGDIGN